MAIKNFVITAKEIIVEKKKFYACTSYVNGRWIKVKFTRDCNNSPKSKGMYHLTVDTAYCSVEKGKTFTKKDGSVGVGNDILWVKKVVELVEFTQAEYDAKRNNDLNDLFGDEVEI